MVYASYTYIRHLNILGYVPERRHLWVSSVVQWNEYHSRMDVGLHLDV